LQARAAAFADAKEKLLAGDENFSYTLSRKWQNFFCRQRLPRMAQMSTDELN
jgi:hypothetical protein